MTRPAVKALTFDVFGTVVDWRSSIIHEGEQLGKQWDIPIDWTRFAEAWRAGYGPSMDKVRRGALPWLNIDALHRHILDELIVEYGLDGLNEEQRDHLNRVWHRLNPWPDSREGLARLRAKYIIATLSNGNVALLVNMAKHANLPWDCILSAELAKHYKPDPQAYLTAASLLGLEPEQVMMVAAHNGDLLAARDVGFQTAFVPRPTEYGPTQRTNLLPDPAIDIVATDFIALAVQLDT